MSNRKEYILPNGKKAVFEYDVCGVGKVTLACMDELMEMIADRPQEWTPCSERLPKSDYMCLVSCKTKKGVKSVNRAYYSNGFWHGSGSMSGVEAWMPLPEPYTADTPQTERRTDRDGDV